MLSYAGGTNPWNYDEKGYAKQSYNDCKLEIIGFSIMDFVIEYLIVKIIALYLAKFGIQLAKNYRISRILTAELSSTRKSINFFARKQSLEASTKLSKVIR